jgi:molybdopterin-guanine dinucleotide biosynthesis protein A
VRSVSAAILAGGRSVRFNGHDKAALVVAGRTILERQIAVISEITSDILIVVRADGPAPALVDTAPVRVITDIVAECGPLGGLHAALTEARGDAVFAAACDMPYLDASFIRYLLALTREADAVVPQTERGYHPLCAAYTRACLEPIARRLADRRLKLADLLAEVRTRIVRRDELSRFGDCAELLANVNTPAEYAELEAVRDHYA